MHSIIKSKNREDNYSAMLAGIKAIIANEFDLVANLANISSIIKEYCDEINWVGFYLVKDNELVLGPFQGKPACVRIGYSKGVCGTAFAKKSMINVPDTHSFPGHIACDLASNSELVIPILCNAEVVAVLDIDSPIYNRFSSIEEEHFIIICQILAMNWQNYIK